MSQDSKVCKSHTSGHRLQAARLTAEVSLRSVARRMKVTVARARDEEEGRRELSVADLRRWQEALQVPWHELFEPPQSELAEPIRQRACLVRLAKTANTLQKKCENTQTHRLANRIVHLLHELMPELALVGTLPDRRPRPRHELGRAADEVITGDLFSSWDHSEDWPVA